MWKAFQLGATYWHFEVLIQKTLAHQLQQESSGSRLLLGEDFEGLDVHAVYSIERA